jgi:tRNA(fMet)-specific endonuclease VapC
LYIFDTDHLGVLQRQRGPDFEKLITRLADSDQSLFFTTIVSFHEQINGWTKYIKKSVQADKTVTGYLRLENILNDFARAQVLPFSSDAAEIYGDLRSQKVRVATMDLRIGSIAIANQMTLLTRNSVDFERIPNVSIEDWTT